MKADIVESLLDDGSSLALSAASEITDMRRAVTEVVLMLNDLRDLTLTERALANRLADALRAVVPWLAEQGLPTAGVEAEVAVFDEVREIQARMVSGE